MNNIDFQSVHSSEQWIADALIEHLGCSYIGVEMYGDNEAVVLYCHECEEVVLSFADVNRMLLSINKEESNV